MTQTNKLNKHTWLQYIQIKGMCCPVPESHTEQHVNSNHK